MLALDLLRGIVTRGADDFGVACKKLLLVADRDHGRHDWREELDLLARSNLKKIWNQRPGHATVVDVALHEVIKPEILRLEDFPHWNEVLEQSLLLTVIEGKPDVGLDVPHWN